MVKRKTWEEFRENKLLWWANRTLHLFGWAIIVKLDDDEKIGEVYPARVRFRGFSDKVETDGFIGLSKYLSENINELEKESKE